MRPLADSVSRFSHISPIYNWIYPMAGARRRERYRGSTRDVLAAQRSVTLRPRALYVHVPFCDTICTFCPLVKGPLTDASVLTPYVNALLREISAKSHDPELTRLPIRAVFFGGGTPSLLAPSHIRQIGTALHDTFDLSAVEEWSVETEVKSIDDERAAAFRSIGATHARFGLQTFSERHRKAFNLTAKVEQILAAVPVLQRNFPNQSCDVLYGMNGQTDGEFFADIEQVLALGLDNIDFYPINIVSAQRKLHRYYRDQGMAPISGLGKLYMTRVLREVLREASYLPHNGHGFVRVPFGESRRNPVTTGTYAFKYHEHVYGPDDWEFIGLGNSAQSYIAGTTIANETSRERYVSYWSGTDGCAVTLTEHADHVNAAKSLAITLPYKGRVDRSSVEWNRLPPDFGDRLEELEQAGLIACDEKEIRLTHEGWVWYSSIMYYLSPREEQAALASLIMEGQKGRVTPTDFETLVSAR